MIRNAYVWIGLKLQLQRIEQAEKERNEKHADRRPSREDDDGKRNEAAARSNILNELIGVGERQKGAAETG